MTDVVEDVGSTSRYLDDLLNIDSPCFEGMVSQVCPPGLQLNKADIASAGVPLFGFTSLYCKLICFF